MRLILLSRASDLAVLQAGLVADALRARWPGIEIVRTTRSSAGDRDDTTPLWKADDKGLFTADLSHDLLNGRADLVVHSWKDLPIEGRPGTRIAATLERADPRDVLLVRREAADTRPRLSETWSTFHPSRSHSCSPWSTITVMSGSASPWSNQENPPSDRWSASSRSRPTRIMSSNDSLNFSVGMPRFLSTSAVSTFGQNLARVCSAQPYGYWLR